MTEKKSRKKLFLIRTGRVFGLMLLLLWLLLETVGFPSFVTKSFTSKLSAGSYLLEADGMRLDLLTGLSFSDVQIFRKKVIGPPAVKCNAMRVRVSALKGLFAGEWDPSVEFVSGEILPQQASGEDEGPSESIKGLRLMLSDISIDSVPIKQLSSDVSFGSDGVVLSNVLCSIEGSGTASGWVRSSERDGASGRITARMDPHLLLPLLTRINWNYTCRLINRFEWPDSKPLVDTTFSISGSETSRVLRSSSVFSMAEFSYRGVTNESCDGVLSVTAGPAESLVSVDSIMIHTGSGLVVGGFAFDMRSRTVNFRTVTDANPKDFFQMVGLFDRSEMSKWQFPGVTRFVSEGKVDLNHEDGNSTYVNAKGASTGMGVGALVADECQFDLQMNATTCTVSNIRGSIWNGTFRARSNIVFGEDSDRVSFGVDLKDADCNEVLSFSSAKTNKYLTGKLSLEMDGSFVNSSNVLENMDGSGRIAIKDGKVFQLPLFGGLTRIMGKIIPGLNFVISQNDMSADFTVSEGMISSDKVSIDGNVLSLNAKGKTGFDGSLDFAIQVKLMSEKNVVAKVLRAVTWPLSKLMEFRLTGTRVEPKWYPVNFSSELLEKIGLKRSSTEKVRHESKP